MVRTATLDLNSRGSFVDDLNSKPGIVMCRDALLHRSHEIQPAFFDSASKKLNFFSFFIFLFLFFQDRDLTASGIFREFDPEIWQSLFVDGRMQKLPSLFIFWQTCPVEGAPRTKTLRLRFQRRKRTEF